mgnify:CR=1 FL=1
MKNLLTLCVLSLAVMGCSKDSDKAKPTTAPHIVEVRVTGTGPAGLGPAIDVTEIDSLGNVTRLIGDQPPALPYSKTVTTSNLRDSKSVRASLAFTYAGPVASLPANAELKAEFLVDGQVRKTLALNNASTSVSSSVSQVVVKYRYSQL